MANIYYQKTPIIIKRIMKYSGGLIKTEKQALYAVMVFFVLSIMISIWLFYQALQPPAISPKLRQQLMNSAITE